MRVTPVLAITLLALAAAAVDPPVARAQAQATPAAATYIDPARGLGIEDLVAVALKESRRLTAGRELVEAARADRAQAARRPNPSIAFLQREQAGGADRQTSASVSLPLELFRRQARIEVAAKAVVESQAELTAVEWEQASRVRREGAQALLAIRLLDLARDRVAAARALRDLIAASVEAGAVPRLDRDVSDVSWRQAEAQIAIRIADAEAAIARLQATLGRDPAEPLLLKRTLAEEVTDAVADTGRRLRARPVDAGARPDVQVLSSKVGTAGAEAAAERQAGRWDLEVMGGFMRTAMSFPQSAVSPSGTIEPVAGRFNEVMVGATVMLPWLNRNRDAVVAAEARQRAVSADLQAATLDARAEATAAERRWTALGQAVDAYQSGLLDLARRNVDVVQQTYVAGRGTLNDVINERRRLLELETEFAMLLGDRLVADLELRRALGVIR